MANQHGTPTPIYQKCGHKDCSNILRRMPEEVLKGKHLYCSRKCMSNVPRKYDPDFIVEFYPFHSCADFAAHYGSATNAMQRAMTKLRAMGYDLPLRQNERASKYKLGDTKMRREGERQYMVILTEDGWRSTTKLEAKAARVQYKTVRLPAGNKITSVVSRPSIIREKPVEVKKHKPRTIPVCINSKTTVFVYTVEEIPAARMKYQHLNNSIYAR